MQESSPWMKGKERLPWRRHFGLGGGWGDEGCLCGGFLLGTGGGRTGLPPGN